MSTFAACTILSPNYIAYGRTLALSYLAHHPGHRFYALIVADFADPTPFADEPFTTVLLHELAFPDLPALAMTYELLELNTNVKPTLMKYLLEREGLDVVTYLDPDIRVYAPLAPVFEALAPSIAVLTPHLTTPVYDGKSPSEQDMLYNGTYNLGFIAVRNTPQALRLLSWWERRCLDLGFSEGRTGLFVDQKWMNLAPGFFENIAVLRHPGCNMAYWNLNDRTLAGPTDAPFVSSSYWSSRSDAGESGGSDEAVPLCFFHFSGIVPSDPANLSKNSNRFTLATRPDLVPLFAAYKAEVLSRKDATLEAIPYGFDTFSDGTAIPRLARRLFAVHAETFRGSSLYDAAGPWYQFARRTNLIAGRAAPRKSTWNDFSTTDRRVDAVHLLLKVALRLLGPNRYELLMRYVAHIATLRNQGVFLKPKP